MAQKITAVAKCRALGLVAGGVLSVYACKADNHPSSTTKDFALSATATNYAVVSGNNTDDVNNFAQLLANQHLGKFAVSGGVGASAADVKTALAAIGAELHPDSTVVFAYSSSDKLDIAGFRDALSSMIAAARGAGVSKAGRLYIFNDSPGASSTENSIIRGFAGLSGDSGMFQQTMELSGDNKAVAAGAIHKGRLAYEVAQAFEVDRNAFAQSQQNPTLSTFFLDVRNRMGGQVQNLSVAIEPEAGKDAILNETLFNPETFGSRTSRKPPQGYVAPTSGVPTNLELPLSSLTAVTNLQTLFKPDYSHMLVEISSAWCGPCAAAAISLAQNQALQARLDGGKCGMATLIVDDGDGTPAAKLQQWFNYLDATAGGDANAATIAKGHSLKTGETGKQFNGDDREGQGDPNYFDFLHKRFGPTSLTGEDLHIQSYPTFFVVDRSGKVVGIKQPSEATEDFAGLMLNLCN